MKKIIIILAILLTGCASLKPVEVLIPVAKKCTEKKAPDTPLLCTNSLNGDEDPRDVLNCAFTDVNVLKNYTEELKTYICD